MKKIILLIGILMISTVVNGCKSNSYNLTDYELGYNKGLGRGIDIAEEEIKNLIEQYTPPEDCMILLLDKYSAKNICKGDKYYEELRK